MRLKRSKTGGLKRLQPRTLYNGTNAAGVATNLLRELFSRGRTYSRRCPYYLIIKQGTPVLAIVFCYATCGGYNPSVGSADTSLYTKEVTT